DSFEHEEHSHGILARHYVVPTETPRYWLVVIDQAPAPAAQRLALSTGDSFWLEWRGKESSETETSWPSEDPARPEDDDAAFLQRERAPEPAPPSATLDSSPTSFMQNQRAESSARVPSQPARGNQAEEAPQPPPPQPDPAPLPHEMDTPWYSVAANFDSEFTVSGLLRILQKILHEMLQQTFGLPNEYLTHLAYHSCYYLSKLQSTSDRAAQRSEPGENPTGDTGAGPLAMVFCITNAFVEAEAALDSLVQHQRELPRRHLLKELRRAEALLKDGRAIFKSWARNPNAPGALPGTAASQNALDGVDFSFLASEEGGVANLDDSLRLALAATQRCNQYMNQLLDWIQGHFHEEPLGG
ncbi:unnamed protein product, partial [Symbiodinium necroappetens]